MQINKVNTHLLPLKFEYYSPKNIEDAFRLLKRYGKESALLAGGTDLISNMKQRLVEPRHLVNLKNIEELRGIKKIDDDLIIGATTRLSEIERSKLIKNEFFLLYEAVKSMATVQIRNMATIGGNLCNASPAADSAVALLTLDAKVQIFGDNGKKTLPIDEFFCEPGKTVLREDELLTTIRVSKIGQDFGNTNSG